jgi:hypothetical protein
MTPDCRLAALALIAAGLLSGRAQAQTDTTRARGGAPPAGAARRPGPASTCAVEGTWDLVAQTIDGKAQSLAGYQQRKMVEGGHFMWLGQNKGRDTLPMRTALDTLRATRMSGGAGTFTVAGNRYTEHLEYFSDARQLGQSVPGTCRVLGGQWFHSFPVPFDTTGPGPIRHVVEIWRRVP